jgi:tRNA nucleotidyltransferase (CCA-adding enzyme)
VRAVGATLPERSVLASLPRGHREAVNAARALSSERGQPLYLVGGPVRDLLLRRPVADVDLTLEGDAPPFAAALSRRIGGRVRVHPAFRTATIELPGGARLDLATARSERYERPGALPRVLPASVHDDLARRDFTINAMALRIAPEYRSDVLDPFGGRKDLRTGVVRLLHAGSPSDDPTRAFRAVRYANRFGFRIAKDSRAAIARALERGAFTAVSGGRLRREIEKIFGEENRSRAVALLGSLGLHAALHPDLPRGGSALSRLRRLEECAQGGRAAGWLAYLLAWSCGLSEVAAGELAARLALRREDNAVLRSWPTKLASLRGISRQAPEEAAATVTLLTAEERLAAESCLSAPDRRAIADAAALPALGIRGRDLVRAGASPGPGIGAALARTLTARRQGKISRRQELDYALAAWRSRG